MNQSRPIGETGPDCLVGASKSVVTTAQCNVYPAPESVRGRVLAALLAGNELTSNAALQRFSTSRLSSAIHRLRQDGWPILTMLIEVQTHDHGRRARIASYCIDRIHAADIGEEGRQFIQSCREVNHAKTKA